MCSALDMKEGTTHLDGVDKQANEVYSKRKLSLETTQQAIKSMSPSQSKSFTVTSRTSKGVERVMSSNFKERKVQRKGKWSVAAEQCALLCFLIRLIPEHQAPSWPSDNTEGEILSSFGSSLSILLLASFDL